MTKRQLQIMMLKYLKSKGYNNIKNTNMYLIAEGDLPICLCAHMDTVFSKPPKTFYFDKEQNVLWSPDALGADDRAGIYIIINLLEKGYKPSIILTDLEEEGGQGADALIRKYPDCPLKECKALIQLDRRGEKDAVYYECDNVDFEEKINSYGFETNWGTFTDISLFGPQWKIAAVNLSVGYLNEHQPIETLHLKWCHNTIDKVIKMLDECKEWLSYAYVPAVYTFNNGYNSSWWSTDTSGKEPWWEVERCICCGKSLGSTGGRVVGGTSGRPEDDFLVCNDCFKQYFDGGYNTVSDWTESPQDG